MKRLWYYYIYLLVVWGLFRYFSNFPEVIEELWFKPVIWLVPLFWWGMAMKSRPVMFGKKWMMSLTVGAIMGTAYFLLVRRLNIQEINFDVGLIFIALATAVTEEMAFSGFVAGYLEKIQKGHWVNLIIVGLMVALIRLPILYFVHKLGMGDMLGVLLFAGASGVINAWIRVETGNVSGSILARMGMNLAVLG